MGGGRTGGWVEKNEGFGLELSSTGGRTRRKISTYRKIRASGPPPNPKVSPPWSPHLVEILTLVCSNKLNGGISTIELIWPTWVEISIHIQGCESNIHPPYFIQNVVFRHRGRLRAKVSWLCPPTYIKWSTTNPSLGTPCTYNNPNVVTTLVTPNENWCHDFNPRDATFLN